jgi:hypothetical protein
MTRGRISSTFHAFLVQFRVETTEPSSILVGRVEHLRTGESIHFESRRELLSFLRERLAADRVELDDPCNGKETQP